MSRKSFENNPIGFLKKFISRSNSLLTTAERLGFPNLAISRALFECSMDELVILAISYRDMLVDLQHWLLLLYTSDESQEVYKLMRDVETLAECYRIKRF